MEKSKKIFQAFGLIALLFFLSCNTLKRSQTRLDKVKRNNPELLSSYCAETYKNETDTVITYKIIKGDSVLVFDTVTVDCKDVLDSPIKIIKVPVVTKVYQTDTVEKEVLVYRENKAALDTALTTLKKTENTLIKETSTKKTYRNLFFGSLGFIVILAVIGFLLLRKKYKVSII